MAGTHERKITSVAWTSLSPETFSHRWGENRGTPPYSEGEWQWRVARGEEIIVSRKVASRELATV